MAVSVAARSTLRVRQLLEERGGTLRLERSLATASESLLKRGVADPIGSALLALLEGVDASSVFLESVGDSEPDEDGTISTVRDVLRTAPSGELAGWDLYPWRVTAVARAALAAGDAFSPTLAEADRLTAGLYWAARTASEVLLPITVEGRWVGSVGLTSGELGRVWTPDEERLLRVAAEMIGVYWERRDYRQRLEELIAAKDEFIASVSHEIRTPLTAVLGFALELKEGSQRFSEHEIADMISLMAIQSQEVADIVDDLLTAVRAEAGTIVVSPQVMSVRGLVGEVLASHSGKVDFSLRWGGDSNLWADPIRTRQVLRNLLTNAQRYGGDSVQIQVVESVDQVTLQVRDNGEGIPLRLRDHIFEPYARGHNGATQPASAGLGLAVAGQLAQLMEGDLELSREGNWTVFSPALPSAATQTVASDVRITLPVGTP
ncbi:MAG: ATP-binding protein [Actinomycetota bacterium]|nr:ATP-binding protein [Actinomycetota bacterium]